MPRKSQGCRVNGLAVIVSELADKLKGILEVYFPGSEEAQKQVEQYKLMAIGMVDPRDGFPIATDLDQSVAPERIET